MIRSDGLSLLVSALAGGAYFDAVQRVALAELEGCLPGLDPSYQDIGEMSFVHLAEPGTIEPGALARLSFCHGVFSRRGTQLQAFAADPSYALPAELVWGQKYAGKTNELVSQLALNLALANCTVPQAQRTVLDPMAGRGTTLLWAARYGLSAVGIERDPLCVEHLHRHIKRQCKVLRLKHSASLGRLSKQNRGDIGRFGRYEFGETTMRLVVGDGADAPALLNRQKFGVIVTDAPYGVAHRGPGGERDLRGELERCAPAWRESLRPGGAIALVFNALLPRRETVIAIFTALGLEEVPLDLSHRMSESILRDIAVFRRP